MSMAGLAQFNENLLAVMASAAFKNADEGERLNMGYALLRSKYGALPGVPTQKLWAGVVPSSSTSMTTEESTEDSQEFGVIAH